MQRNVDLFETFANRSKNSMNRTKNKLPSNFFYQLHDNEGRFELHVLDGKGKKVECDYRMVNGVDRSILKVFSESESDVWDEDGIWSSDGGNGGLLLEKYPHVLRSLSKSNNVVDVNFEHVWFHSGIMDVQLVLIVKDGIVNCSIQLNDENNVVHKFDNGKPLRVVSESYLFSENTFFYVGSIGQGYQHLPLFLGVVPESQLNEYLSLFCSSGLEVELLLDDYEVQEGASLHVKPAIVFQQVDENSALYLDVVQTIPGFSVEFADKYNLERVAFADNMSKVILMRNVVYSDIVDIRSSLTRKIKKLASGLNSDEAYFVDDTDGLILGPELASSFLNQHLTEFIKDFELFGAEKLKTYNIRHVEPRINVTLEHGIDFLEGSAVLELGGEQFALFDALHNYNKNRYIALSDGSHAVIDNEYIERLSRIFKKNGKGVKVSFFDLPVLEKLITDGDNHSSLPKSRNFFQDFNNVGRKRLQLSNFVGSLRPYQASGVKWLKYLHEHRLGGCLADDMGLGKTIQAIAFLSGIYPKEKKATLLVMPRSLIFNWQNELLKFAPKLSSYTYYGTNRDMKEAIKHNLILTTYGVLRSSIESFVLEKFHVVVLDESQAIKNLNTKIAKSALALNCEFRLALSGTPVENNLSELYTLFRFLNPSMFGSAGDFERHYASPIQKAGEKAVIQELRSKIKPFLLRRLKSDVLKDLPPKVEQVLAVEMNDKQKKLYETKRQFYKKLISGEIEQNGFAKSRFAILEALLELRQIATVPEVKSENTIESAKKELLVDMLQEAVGNNRKCLVFTNFLAGVEQVAQLLNEVGVEYITMTGSTTNRAQLVERFQTDQKLKVFIMTLKTGGVGLNLTAADTVFILDPWWNTSAEVQAIDRTHRIGQQKTVFTYRLIAKDTIEEKIMKLQQHKKELIDSVVSSDGAALKRLSEEDIDYLLGDE